MDFDVSVIIPCHNHAMFLGEAIETVLVQTHPKLEVMVVDDGSTDQSREVASAYPAVRCISQERRGLAGARNTGLCHTSGIFVVFLDADDRLLPHALEVGLAHFRRTGNCAFVYGAYRYISADGRRLGEVILPAPDDIYTALLRRNFIAMHAAAMFRRTALIEVGGYDESLPACEDYDLYLRLSRRFRAAGHQQLVAEYRLHGANMSSDPALMLQTSLAVLNRQRPFIAHDPKRRQAYKAGLRFWQKYYGTALMSCAISKIIEPGGHRQALAGLAGAIRTAPYAVPWLGVRVMMKAPRRIRGMLPGPLRRVLNHMFRRQPRFGQINFGDLRRTTPFDAHFGYNRGSPVDRYYIERFLGQYATDIRGRVLEVGDREYTRRFGRERVARSDILHVDASNPLATVVGDLASGNALPADAFDCIILTQTLHLIYDVHAAAGTLYRMLKPGGMLLATVPGTSQVDRGEWGRTWFWSFTAIAARRLFETTFGASNVAVESHGNVLAAITLLHGVAAEELRPEELDHQDMAYPVIVTIRAQKAMLPS